MLCEALLNIFALNTNNKMKTKNLLLIALAGFLFSCQNAPETTTEKETETIIEEEKEVIDKEKLIQEIDAYRREIESKKLEAKELSTADLRSKISQKWSKIHFYMMDDQLVRVKTYPHASISERTEEFYAKDGNLVSAVIEDTGTQDSIPSEDNFNKVYYFQNGEFVTEINKTSEKEYKIKDSEAEELLQEFNEYKELSSKF